MSNQLTDSRRRFLTLAGQVGGAVSLGLFSAGAWATSGVSHLQKIRAEALEGSVRLNFDLTTNSEHVLFKLPSPNHRVVLDLKNTRLGAAPKFDIDAAGHMVNKLRYASRDNDVLRVVLDVNEDLKASTHVVKSGAGQRLVLTLSSAKQAPAVVAPVAKPQSKSHSGRSGRDLIVAIDAGHGGKDPGAVGKRGTYEKDIVLQVARRLEALLKKEPGLRPVMIRDRDVFLPLRERIRSARRHKADLFVSIHADAARNRKATGSSVYILSENGASSEAARLLAEQENAVDLIGGVSLDDKDDVLAEVLLDLSQRHTIESSHAVASDMLSELGKVGDVHKHSVEQAGFAVLKSPDIPSVLVETAFISNPSEEKRLRTSAYQNKIAKSLLKGIRSYFSKNAPADSLMAWRRENDLRHTIRSGETLSGIAVRYRTSVRDIKAVNRLNSDRVRIGQVLKIPTSQT